MFHVSSPWIVIIVSRDIGYVSHKSRMSCIVYCVIVRTQR